MDEIFDNKSDEPIKLPNDISGIEPVDDNKDEPDPIENVLVLDKEPDYNNDKPPAHPPMGMPMTWATDEEIAEFLKKHREEMEKAEEDAKLIPGLSDLGAVVGGDIPEQGPDLKGGEIPEQGPDVKEGPEIGIEINDAPTDSGITNIIEDKNDPNYYSQFYNLVDQGVDTDINHARQTLLNLKNKLLEEDALDREAGGLALHR